MTMLMKRVPLIMLAAGAAGWAAEAAAPAVEISNKQIHARLYLPDPARGFYRGTRFDWSGVVVSLEYKGHSFFGQWFTHFDPAIRDVAYDPGGHGYAAGPASAAMGPVEEFTGPGNSAPGYDEAKPGELFLKIGVGALRKIDGSTYDRFFPYPIADSGKWTVRTSKDRVEFEQAIRIASGYGYAYRKTIRLAAVSPEMVIGHSLKNTGTKPIDTSVYNHNFFVIDHQQPRPDVVVSFPFPVKASDPMTGFAEVRGREIHYTKVLENDDRATSEVTGFGTTASDNTFAVENRRTGAGVRVTGDHPLKRLVFWTIRSVVSPEAFVHLRVEPGEEVRWSISWRFYEAATSRARR
jgi:hypothetical protein